MQDGFFGLNVAVRGLYTAQRGLDIVNHNLNNVNTPGYSRQQAIQAASKPMALYDGTGMVGTGADVTGVQRVRDEYLDFKYWSENIAQGEWSTKKELLAEMEATFNEPSDSGFTTVMNDFYNSLQELSKDPSSSAVRALVREKGVTLTKYFNSTYAHLEKMQGDVNYQIKTKVDEINSIGTQVQQLNRQIYTSELDGNTANDLRDQRGVLVDKLSKLINIDAQEVVSGKLPNGKDDKHFVITISGKAFVDHYNLSKLDIPQRQNKLNPEDIDGLYDVQWADGNKLDIKGGELKAYLDVRDGKDGMAGVVSGTNSPLYKGVPYYMMKMNQFAQTFAMAFNEGYIKDNTGTLTDGVGHSDGKGLDPDGSGPKTASTNIRFFTMLGSDDNPISSNEFINLPLSNTSLTGMAAVEDKYRYITAKNISVSEDVTNNTNTIATADSGGQDGNINVINKLIDMRQNANMFSEGAPEDFMKSLVTTLGIDSQQAVRLSSNQEAIVKQIDNRRLSNSGVSVDEEMANLVKFQHAYNASARMITTMSEVYDTLINKMGVR